MGAKSMNRRDFLRLSVMFAGGLAVAACGRTSEAEPTNPTSTTQATTHDGKALIAGGAYWAPWQIYEGATTTGIGVEIMQEISKRIKQDIVFKQLSQNRMLTYFEANQIDLELVSNPIWRAEYKDVSLYSISYIQTMDVVMMKTGSDLKPTSIQDFRGKRMGGIMGYAYPEFEQEFKNGTIIREDAPNESNSVEKLLADRIDAIIIEKNTALYWMKQLQVDPAALEAVYEVAKYDIYLRLHRNKKSWLPALNDALTTMIGDGTIQKIVDKYTM